LNVIPGRLDLFLNYRFPKQWTVARLHAQVRTKWSDLNVQIESSGPRVSSGAWALIAEVDQLEHQLQQLPPTATPDIALIEQWLQLRPKTIRRGLVYTIT
jgi:hypothetical protein